jgi:uroporphyrinogen-III synthase
MSDLLEQRDFGGLRVLSLESRRAEVMDQLIRKHGGLAFVAPSVKETPVEQHAEACQWAERLFGGEFSLVILMTVAGLAQLRTIVAGRYGEARFPEALRRVATIARGPKTAAALADMDVHPAAIVPEPSSWREILTAVTARPERRIGIQEHGRPNPEFVRALHNLGAQVWPLMVYRWTLPDDTGPLREAVRRIADRRCDVVLFTTSIQLAHLLEVAKDMGRDADVREALSRDVVIGSVGPVMNASLEDCGLMADIVPAQPQMALLVRAAAETAAKALGQKRSGGQFRK